MGSVTFISETGWAHAAIKVNNRDWYGFKPIVPKTPTAPGFVDRSDRTFEIKHSVTFTIDDAKIQVAVPAIVGRYAKDWYVVGIRDCVSFVADIAEALGLQIPKRPNFLPDNFVMALGRLNGRAALPAVPPK
jgi:hypothetical protein